MNNFRQQIAETRAALREAERKLRDFVETQGALVHNFGDTRALSMLDHLATKIKWLDDDCDFASDALETEDEEEELREPATGLWSVAIYLVDRECGGAEEGGWWYDAGDLVRTFRTFKTEGEAYNFALRTQAKLDASLNKGRREISSVLSTGRYSAEVYEGEAPKHFPETRPHYE